MNIVGIAGSNVGSKTRTAIDYTLKRARDKYPDATITLLSQTLLDGRTTVKADFSLYEGAYCTNLCFYRG